MDNINSEENNNEFAELLNRSFTETESLTPGQQIETDIVSIAGDTVFLELNGKTEGVLDRAELADKDGNIQVEVGDRIKVFFLYAKSGEMHFTTRISGDKAGEAGNAVLQTAYESAIPVEGLVEKEIKGGFDIRIGEARAFCPYSQMGLKRVENAAEWIGKNLTFKITEFSENGRNILVSNRTVLEEEHDKKIVVLKKTLRVNMVVKGIVKEIRDFGAFVDIDGIQALLPVSEISRERVEDINSVLKVGSGIEASILSIDWKRERISLSMKALLADPWDDIETKYKKGSKYTGTVARVTSFGAFVTLEPGLDGLIHISELREDSRDSAPADKLKTGQKITVLIKDIDKGKKRLSLKPSSTIQEDEATKKYLDSESDSDSDTYNPFAALLKDRKKK